MIGGGTEQSRDHGGDEHHGETGQNDARMPGTDPNAENTGGTKGKDPNAPESGGGTGEDQNLNENQKQQIAAEVEQKSFEQLEKELKEKLKLKDNAMVSNKKKHLCRINQLIGQYLKMMMAQGLGIDAGIFNIMWTAANSILGLRLSIRV